MELNNITKLYNNNKVINNINFSFGKHNIIGLIGKNGVGKTTLMKIITGNITNFKGEVVNNNKIGYSIENPKLYDKISGYENLKIFSYILTSNFNKNYIESLIKDFDMSEYIHKKVKKYSMGMKQKLSIAISLINNPDILILDEPTNGMDPDGSIKVLKTIKKLSLKYNMKVLISSHKLEDIELICSKALFLKKGVFVKEVDMTNEESHSSTIVITATNDFKNAYQILENKFNIKESNITENSIILNYQDNHSNIISELSKEHIFPKSVFNKTNTLRDTYFNINEGDE
ncbi:ABC transporter ATP-binding protein [Staphylococcus caprae]|uniref:phenol-soluble modulin export ABC transporter ATP-binding protein PmtC n=1 Tax=Staphylococcus caprae TaxID=29380 RepID=UPI001C82A605|nr:ABC transporter ATP-binding protein [Staphylococcus caprae]MBX5320271.1 ABC transporter ATP-binding protein [Staphylococcus caprae]